MVKYRLYLFKYCLYEMFVSQLCDRINKKLCVDSNTREYYLSEGKHSGVVSKCMTIYSHAGQYERPYVD